MVFGILCAGQCWGVRFGFQDRVLSNSAPHTTRLSAVLQLFRAEPSVSPWSCSREGPSLSHPARGRWFFPTAITSCLSPHILISVGRQQVKLRSPDCIFAASECGKCSIFFLSVEKGYTIMGLPQYREMVQKFGADVNSMWFQKILLLFRCFR